MQSIKDFLNIHPIKYLICWFHGRHNFMTLSLITKDGLIQKQRACCIVCGKLEDNHD